MQVTEMEGLLKQLGMEVVTIRGVEIQASCPAHKERTGHADRNPSFWINSDSGAFICFSCGFKGSVLSLISYVEGISFEEAAKNLSSNELGLKRRIEKFLNEPEEVFEEIVDFTESTLAAFSEPTPELLRGRGLTSEAADKYGVLYDKRTNSWILQIRDPLSNSLLGWQEKGVSSRHFKNFPTGVKKAQALFGYSQYTSGDLIVLESPLDAVRLASVGISGGVATYGSIVSKAQLNLIKGADRVVVAMDHDEAGIKSSLDILNKSYTMGFECWFFDYSHTDCKDVGGMSKTEIVRGIENAKHSVRGTSAIN